MGLGFRVQGSGFIGCRVESLDRGLRLQGFMVLKLSGSAGAKL